MNKPEKLQPIPSQADMPHYYYPQEDETSLADCYFILIKQKKTFFAILALSLIGALIFALAATPIYKAEAVFMRPTESDIQSFNVKDIQQVSVVSAYSMFRKNLQSMLPRRIVFEKMNLREQLVPNQDPESSAESIFETFNESLLVSTPRKSNNGVDEQLPIITLSIESESPELAAEIVNRLAAEVERATSTEIISDIQAKVNARTRDLIQDINLLKEKTRKLRLDKIERLEIEITLEKNNIIDRILAKQNAAKQKRLDKIEELSEAAKIAHDLGLKKPLMYTFDEMGETSSNASELLVSSITTSLPKTYSQGYEALEAEVKTLSSRKVDDHFIPEIRELTEKLEILKNSREIELLRSRKSDDPFIDSLRDKESKLAYLESIFIDPKTVKTAILDQAAFSSNQRVKPDRKLIVAMGLVLGLVLGIFGVFLVHFVGTLRKQKEALSES